jgi:hypothetical protein
MFAHPILRRDLVICHALFWKNHTDSHVLAVLIGRSPLLDNICLEARTLIDPQNAGHTAHDTADHTANDGADRTSRPFTIPGAPLDAPWYALGLSNDGERNRDNDRSSSEQMADH